MYIMEIYFFRTISEEDIIVKRSIHQYFLKKYYFLQQFFGAEFKKTPQKIWFQGKKSIFTNYG